MKRIFKVCLLWASVFVLSPGWATEQDAPQDQGNTLKPNKNISDITILHSNANGQLLAHDADLFEAFEKSEGLNDISPDNLASFDEPLDGDDS